jgi:alpha-galactosidase
MPPVQSTSIAAPLFLLTINGSDDAFLRYNQLAVHAPTVVVDGVPTVLASRDLAVVDDRQVFGDVREIALEGHVVANRALFVAVVLRISESSPVLRFCYRLRATSAATLSKPAGRDVVTYGSVSLANAALTEVRLSEFDGLAHSYLPSEHRVEERHFTNEQQLMGPILTAQRGDEAILWAYEHGSEYPDAFLAFRLTPDQRVILRAIKGNTLSDQPLGPDAAPFESPWFQLAVVKGDTATLARIYRMFVLKHLSPNAASRTPFLFYNTWNYQERVRHDQGKPYLAELNETRVLAEIEIAHRVGIDVFVIDAGWFEKTGDWKVSTERFPRGLAPITERLAAYGMKLGLWFNPTVAALSSGLRGSHEDCLMMVGGQPYPPSPVWETEASQGISVVSRYWEAFADTLIALAKEVGVTYFKWDAIGQYSSDAAGHFHGTDAHSVAERRDRYAFLLGRYLTRIVDRVCAACPDAIVDFDITEGGRTVGLQFLSAGKYFLINNGPYCHEYQVQNGPGNNPNLVFAPGPTRAALCRRAYAFDRWIPSVLFLTHYLPDDDYRTGWGLTQTVPGENRNIAIASLIAGHNGIWGDLLGLSEEGIDHYAGALAVYKAVRDDITEAYPVFTGTPGSSPEVIEKISERTGRGAVSLFTSRPGAYRIVTENAVADGVWGSEGIEVQQDANGRAIVTVTFSPGQCAKYLFFGVDVSA